MKKLSIFIAMIALAGVLFAQDAKSDVPPNKAVSFNILGPIVNYYAGSYEFALGKNLALKIDGAFSPNFIWVSDLGLLGLFGEARFYLGSAVDGLYLGAGGGALMAYGQHTSGGVTTTFTGFLPVVEGEVGYKMIFGRPNGIYLEPYVGYQFYAASVSVTTSSGGASASTPTLGGAWYGINLGWAFQ